MKSLTLFLCLFLSACESQTMNEDRYQDVSFAQLLDNPAKYNGVWVRVEGIYSGETEPVLFKDRSAFVAFNPKEGLLIANKSGKFQNVKHGKEAIVEGVFSVLSDEYVKVYFGELREVRSVRGK